MPTRASGLFEANSAYPEMDRFVTRVLEGGDVPRFVPGAVAYAAASVPIGLGWISVLCSLIFGLSKASPGDDELGQKGPFLLASVVASVLAYIVPAVLTTSGRAAGKWALNVVTFVGLFVSASLIPVFIFYMGGKFAIGPAVGLGFLGVSLLIQRGKPFQTYCLFAQRMRIGKAALRRRQAKARRQVGLDEPR